MIAKGPSEDIPSKSSILKKADCIIADATATMICSMWAEVIDQIQEDQCYKFSEMSVRTFNNKILSSTPETTIEIINPLENVKTNDNLKIKKNSTENITILSIKVISTFTCIACGKSIENKINPDMKLVKCDQCNRLQKIANLENLMKGDLYATIAGQDDKKRFILSNALLKSYEPTKHLTTPTDIETYFMENDTLKVEIDTEQGKIIKIVN